MHFFGGIFMTSEQIECFFKVAELGSFTAAAEAMYMAQPALSKRINTLETELGISLFSRDKSKRTQLTDAGKIVYDGFKNLYGKAQQVIEQAKCAEKGMTGTVRLGIFENQIIDEYLQEILNDFAKHCPGVELYVTTDSFEGLIQNVMNGTLDCAVTLQYDLTGRSKIQHKTLYKLETVLVVPKIFMKDPKDSYSLKDFAEKPFLTISESGNTFLNRMLKAQTKEAGFEPELVMASDEKNYMMMLELGKGIAILDAYSKCCNSPNVECIRVPEIGGSPFDLVWSEKNANPAFRYFLKYLQI